jgi:hypothetical protein
MLNCSAGGRHDLQELEARKIYKALFGAEIPPRVRDRFLDASNALFPHAGHGTDDYYAIISSVKDLEALEVACRYTGKNPLLPLKFKLMVYLAECVPENQHFFVNEHRCLLRGSLSLGAGFVRTCYKLCKGFYLLIRHDRA